jgi:hypothetical protein
VTTIERTRQQLDPAGSTGVAPVAIFLSTGAFLYALVMTIRNSTEISNPLFGSLALALLAIACLLVISGSSPSRAPLTAGVHAAAHTVTFAAIVCEAVSQWGSNAYIRDDWGPAVLGIILVALGPYRPAREIAGAGLISAVSIGILTYLEVPSLVTPGPPIAFVAVAITPMLALCFSAAMFSNGVVSSIERWQKRAQAASVSLVNEFRESIARSVQQDRVTILNRDVIPFFTEVLARDHLTAEDRERARTIADSIRRVMVEEVDRTWLEALAESTGRPRLAPTAPPHRIVDDPDGLAGRMTVVQRTAVRALLVAFGDVPEFTRRGLTISLAESHGTCNVLVNATLPISDFVLRSTFAPFLAVLRAVFTDLEVDFVQPELTLRFSYDHN